MELVVNSPGWFQSKIDTNKDRRVFFFSFELKNTHIIVILLKLVVLNKYGTFSLQMMIKGHSCSSRRKHNISNTKIINWRAGT
jgi:hypothetical protein